MINIKSHSHNFIRIFRNLKSFLFLAIICAILIASCRPGKYEKVTEPQIPYPNAKMAIYLQAHVDSSEYVWFTDVKAAASSFCNEEMPQDSGAITVGDITVMDESMYHAKVEVNFPKKVIILTMERAFKEKGTNSIWQIVKMENKKD